MDRENFLLTMIYVYLYVLTRERMAQHVSAQYGSTLVLYPGRRLGQYAALQTVWTFEQ